MFATPDEAENAFYDALRQADLTRLMQVWADDEEIVCIHPSGMRLTGYAAILSSWQHILASGPLMIYPIHPVAMTTLFSAVHVLIEQVTLTGPESGKAVNFHTSNVFHKSPTGWRMVLHHASNAPADARMFDLQDIPDTLH